MKPFDGADDDSSGRSSRHSRARAACRRAVYLTHNTGVLWDRDAGIPVLSTERVLRLAKLG